MMRRVSIQWTRTARDQLAELEPKARKGIIEKADRLVASDDPRKGHKPLYGPLAGYFRLTYARYRAVYSVEDETLANGDILMHVKITFIAVGQRKEPDKKDIYRIAEKLVSDGIIPLGGLNDDSSER
jgi:mRNA-degrading endonuclease RelE of RelBE toxin-antitoxin system